MYAAGDVIDEKFRVDGVCDTSGGMGNILFVSNLEGDQPPYQIVLKYCKSALSDHITRFKREVRLLATFNGNSRVVEMWSDNIDHNPPYFVMKYYPEGNASNLIASIRSNRETQEQVFLKMLDCVNELHIRSVIHRDLKPQNFLIDGQDLRIADLGLSYEIGSLTAFTATTDHLGTAGYLPPEFLVGEFRGLNPASDIFMLGRTFYVLVTDRPPSYMIREGVDPPLFYVLEKAANMVVAVRYQSIAEFRQALVNVYDVLLGRAGGRLHQLASLVTERFNSQNQFSSVEIGEFVEQLAMAPETEQQELIPDLPPAFFSAISQPILVSALRNFLPVYAAFVDTGGYSYSYAETIAARMEVMFLDPSVPDELKATILRSASRAAAFKNRFAAMDTCRRMVRAINSDGLALSIIPIISETEASFLADIEPISCHSELIKNAIRSLRRSST